MSDSHDRAERGDQFHHDDGTLEVVFHVEGDRVLTVREYPTRQAYGEAVAEADPGGKHEEILELPDVSAFEEMDF